MIIRFLAATIMVVALVTLIPACAHDATLSPNATSSGVTASNAFVSDATVLVHGIT